MKTRTRGGILRAVGVALAGALIAASGAGAAQAADPKPVIDPAATGSITIHKFECPDEPLNLPSNGMEQDVVGATPIDGGTFTVRQVQGYDLTTNAGWAALSTLTVPPAQAGPFGAERTVTTAGGGVGVASGLPVGVYLVTETVYPSGATPVDPFLVTVSLTNPANDAEWIYDIHVYPKNPITTATKTVDDSSAVKIGDPVTWTILGDIPEAEVIDGYQIVDQLDTKLTHVSTQVTLTNGTALADGDYTIAHDAGTNTVSVQFTASGLVKLAANSAAQVQVVVNTTVNAIGEIVNEAVVYPNLPSFTIQPGQPGGPTVTPEVETEWGNVTLHKVAKSTGADLAGAEFKVFLTRAEALAGTNPIRSGTTNGDGELTFTGLRYSGWADGKAVAACEDGYQSYWIVETKAPDGYELLAVPIEVVVDDIDAVVDYTVENVPNNGGFELPLTGGVGTIALTAAGLLLITDALLLAARYRRRQAVEG